MKWTGISRRWSLALAVGFVSAASSAGACPRLSPEPVVQTALSCEEREAPAAEVREGEAESQLARLWEDVAMNPESAIALARLANEYAEAGETKLALQSFQVALDQLSTDPDLDGAGRARFRDAVEKRMRFLRQPGTSFAGEVAARKPWQKPQIRTEN